MPRRHVQTSGPATTPVVVPQGDAKALAERLKAFPAIDVLTRRFSDPNDPGSLPILLTDEDPHACTNSDHINKLKPGATACHLCKPKRPARIWYVRWFNLAAEGRNAQMKSKGYIPVTIKELQDAGDVADLYESTKDKIVRRGDRGQEVLAKMPLEAYTYVKGVQRAAWNARLMNKKNVRADLAEAAGAELGDEAGQSIHDGMIQVESITRSKTTLGDEADLGDA
jgi:hypothetical protein